MIKTKDENGLVQEVYTGSSEIYHAENATQEGQKADSGKPRPTLLPVDSLLAITDVLEFGATKYGKDNWKSVPNATERYSDALMRHVYAYLQGERKDAESGLQHLAHAGACLLFLLHFENGSQDNEPN